MLRQTLQAKAGCGITTGHNSGQVGWLHHPSPHPSILWDQDLREAAMPRSPWKGLWGLLVSLQRGAALEGHQWILPSLLTPCRIRKEGQGTQEHTWGLSPKTLNWDRQWQEAVRGQGPSQSKRKECFQHKAWPDGPRVLDTREGAPGALRMLWALEQRKGLAFLPSGGDNG